MRFVLATLNPDKGRELEPLLAEAGVELVTLAELAPDATAPEEHGHTLLENARIKASAALARTGMPAIADDTGLEVDALGGAPGVRAARYAGPTATYADNRRALVAALQSVPRAGRTARFRTVCVARLPGGREVVGEGVLEGRIGDVPRGTFGFGYDSIFELPDGRTLAELEPAEKQALSHRARAVRALATSLAPLVREPRG